jgi:hypothetical protein
MGLSIPSFVIVLLCSRIVSSFEQDDLDVDSLPLSLKIVRQFSLVTTCFKGCPCEPHSSGFELGIHDILQMSPFLVTYHHELDYETVTRFSDQQMSVSKAVFPESFGITVLLDPEDFSYKSLDVQKYMVERDLTLNGVQYDRFIALDSAITESEIELRSNSLFVMRIYCLNSTGNYEQFSPAGRVSLYHDSIHGKYIDAKITPSNITVSNGQNYHYKSTCMIQPQRWIIELGMKTGLQYFNGKVADLMITAHVKISRVKSQTLLVRKFPIYGSVDKACVYEDNRTTFKSYPENQIQCVNTPVMWFGVKSLSTPVYSGFG